MASDPKQVQAVFLAAVEESIPNERIELLDRECKGNTELRRRVEALLFAHDHPESLPHAAGAILGDTNAPLDLYRAGAVIAGRYKLLEQIGEGGMGAVWVAEQTEPVRRRVALKLIKPGMDTKQVLSRFAAERQALALMDHPNIAKVFDGGMTEEGRPYFVMEYVKGVPITEYCDQAKLSIEERLNLFLPICQAVQHAHQKGIIHRDLKPSNVLVCPYDGQPVPKVIDFGLAKAISQPLTENTLYTAHGIMVGTPLYMSPEQAEFNNLDVDTRTDIYSLGVILYELLTGATPLEKQKFKDAAFAEILRLIKEVEPPKPSTKLGASATLPVIAAQRSVEPAQLDRLVRGELDWIVMKCLEKDRSRRYETANGLARDVERYLHDDLVEARPPSASYRLGKFVRKNRTALAMAASIALLLVAGVAVSIWQAVRATAAERQAMLAANLERQAKEAEAQERQRAEAERNRAEASEKTATTEKSNAQAALDFIQNELLSQASTEEEPDRDLKLRIALDRAVSMVTGAYQLLREDLGEDHPTTIFAEGALALLYQWQGKYAESEALDVRALEIRRRVLGVTHPLMSTITQRLAITYEKQGKLDQAISLLTERLAFLRKSTEDNPLRLVSPISQLGRLLLLQKKYEEAEPLLREARKLTESLPDSWSRFVNQSNLGASLVGQGKYDEAEPHLLTAYQGLKERESSRVESPGGIIEPGQRVTEVLERLVDLYTAWNTPAEAAKWREVLDNRKTAEQLSPSP